MNSIHRAVTARRKTATFPLLNERMWRKKKTERRVKEKKKKRRDAHSLLPALQEKKKGGLD